MKIVARIMGALITGLAFFYLIRSCLKLDYHVLQLNDPARACVALSLFIGAYVFFFILIAWVWIILLRVLSRQAATIPFRDVLGIYFRTNILKYLPGNFMEFVGRNYLVNRYRVSHGDIALSSILETILLIIASLSVAAVCSFDMLKDASIRWHVGFGAGLLLIFSGFMLAVFVTGILVKRIFPEIWQRVYSLPFLKTCLVSLLLDSLVIIWLGLLFAGIIVFVLGVPVSFSHIFTILAAVALSWTGGFVTPGAPGGLGVREAMLYMLLSTTFASGPLMVTLALHRLVSILGDGAVFAVGCLFPLKAASGSTRQG